MDPVIVEKRPEVGTEPPPVMQSTPRDVSAAMTHAATRAVLLAGTLIVAGLLFRELVTLVVVGVVTIIVAILLSLVAEPLVRRGVPRALAALAGVVLLM